MRLSSIASTAYHSLLLLPLVSSEALPALDPCWRQCVTHQLPCPDDNWQCFCRQARTTSFLADSVTCIRQACTAGRPFSPVTLLTPFEEKCKDPVPPTVIANANTLAAQDPAPTRGAVTQTSADQNPDIKVVASSTQPSRHANVITTTFLGIATDANGQQETFTVPALIGTTGTVWGRPVTGGQGAASPTSTVTLPWPTLPVGYFSLTRSSASHTTSAPGEQSNNDVDESSAATATKSAAVGTSSTSSKRSKQTGDSSSSDGGTILEAGQATNHRAGSSLGLMVVLMAGVIWF